MSLQQHFSFKRFYNYLKFDLLLNGKKYLGFIAVLWIVLFLLDFFLINTASIIKLNETGIRIKYFRLDTYQPTFLVTLILSLILVVGSSFPALRKKDSTINFLFVPVSLLEKYLVQFVFRILIFSVIYIVLFWLDFKFATFVYNLFEWKNQTEVPSFELLNLFKKNIPLLDRKIIVLSIFSIASLLFASSTFFNKNALLKTILTLGVLGLITYLFSVLLSHVFLPNQVQGFNVTVFDRKLSNNLNTIQILVYVIGVFSSLFFLPLAYFKLKEKEV